MLKKPLIKHAYILLFFMMLVACKTKNMATANYAKPKAKIASKFAEIMQVDKSDIKNGRLYEFIDEWEGTPYRFGGLDKNGIDCSGFTFTLYKEVYLRTIPRNTSALMAMLKRKYEDELKEGDLVFFDYDNKKFSHVGIYLQNGYYVHASTKKGVIIMKLKDPYTYKYFSRCGELKSE